jgi:hypothetical protein
VSCTFNAIENGKEVDVISTDFSKAFDMVSHAIIIFKLRALGFPPNFLTWVESYIKDRKYRVQFRSSTSDPFIATSGVPQGSHLGPILFILSINDVESVLKYSNLSAYADDMKIFCEITSPMDSHQLQQDLNNFNVWCKKNQLALNVGKCQTITYSRRRKLLPQRDYFIAGVPVNRTTAFRDLGVFCDTELNFRLHLESIVNRANSALGFVKRWSREFSNPYVTKALYTTFVRPILEYASQVWSPYHGVHIKRIESVQRRFLLFALRGLPWVDNFNLPPYQDRLNIIKLQSLEKRREVADIIFIHQLLSGTIDSPAILCQINFNINSRHLRSVPIFSIATHRTDYGKNEPITRMLREVNKYCAVFDYCNSKQVQRKLLHAF